MAKTRRYRRFRKYSKWSANISEFSSSQSVNNGIFYLESTLASNPIQNTAGVSQTYTAKNFDINFILEAASSGVVSIFEDLCIYIMYVPQGFNVTSDYNVQHPEFILNYKYIGSPSADGNTEGQQFQPIRIRSRMSRRLQTGDSIILFIKGNNQSTVAQNLDLHGVIRWWTKAN